MTSYKIAQLIKKAIDFENITAPLGPQIPPMPNMMDEDGEEQILYRCQPKGRSLIGHTSGLGSEKINGLFAFEKPEMIFKTYSWIHMRKNIDDYEMITFLGKIIDRPADSEGVVVIPTEILSKVPLKEFASKIGVPLNKAAGRRKN